MSNSHFEIWDMTGGAPLRKSLWRIAVSPQEEMNPV